MRFRLAGLLVLLLLGAAAAQARLLPALDTFSPHATMQSLAAETQRIAALFVAYRAEPRLDTGIELRNAVHRASEQLLDLSDLPAATRRKDGARALAALADILLRLPEIPAGSIPGAPGQASALPARWTLPGTEIRIERMGAPDAPPDFRFSRATVARLDEFHAQVSDQPPLRPAAITDWREAQVQMAGPLFPPALVERLPAPLRSTVLETTVWKILAAAAVTLASILAVLAWVVLVRRWARGTAPLRRTARWLSVPLVLALVVVVAHVLIDSEVNLSGVLSDAETLGATFLLYGAGAWGAVLAFRLVAEAIIASPRVSDDSYDAHLLRLLARVAGLFAAAVVLVYGANAIGIPALGLVAGLGVGGVAVALASQSTVENLFGGVSIFADRPFRVGDTIRFAAAHGVVESIGPRSTRIRGPDGTLTTVPNADIAKAHVTNLSVRSRFLFDHRVTLPPGTGEGEVSRVLDALRGLLADQPTVSPGEGLSRVRLVALTPLAIEIQVYAQVVAADQDAFLQVQEALLLRILQQVRPPAPPPAA
ncbi:mechanosensitive ion channel family protein [Roseomonas rosulenta]|uniref:mechanosensitive ion channel family protein n=1 Tax=Roseomonas rosulenta TaxID=2748667 RepID=UPI0018DF2EED|nr:mechanosensitive ion channel domain-containing protein [Roseomonas rosulenta]